MTGLIKKVTHKLITMRVFLMSSIERKGKFFSLSFCVLVRSRAHKTLKVPGSADGLIEFSRRKLKCYIWLSVKGTKDRATSLSNRKSLEKGLNALKGFCVLRQNYQSINDINCMLNSIFSS